MITFLKEPLLHFLALGALIFGAYAWLERDAPRADEIVVTRGQQEHLVNIFLRTWQRAPTAEEFEGLVQDFVREEIAYREGTAMGLAENDTVIRRRIRQKLELLTDDIVSLDEPTEAELQTFLDDNPALFKAEPRLDLRHIFFIPDRRGDQAGPAAAHALTRLPSEPEADWTVMGDPLPIGDYLDNTRASELDRLFGSGFGARVAKVEAGQWAGPVASEFGLHLIFVDDYVPAGEPRLETIRQQVRSEWLASRRLAATEILYERLTAAYRITIEPLQAPPPP